MRLDKGRAERMLIAAVLAAGGRIIIPYNDQIRAAEAILTVEQDEAKREIILTTQQR